MPGERVDTSAPSSRLLESLWLVTSAWLVVAFTWHHMDILGDGFWYIASGEWVLDHRQLPLTDPFAFTSAHVPWLLHFPAAQLGFAWLTRHLGLMAVLVVSTAVSAAAGLVLWFKSATSLPARAAGLLLLLGSIELGKDDLSARGQVFGDLGFAILLLCMLRLKRRQRVSPMIPFALTALWTNFHPSFLLSIAFPLLVAATTRLDPVAERPPLRPFLVWSAIALVATGLNPYSYVLVVDVVRMTFHPTTSTVDLFQSPDFHSVEWLIAVAIAPLLMAALARRGEPSGRRSHSALLVALLFLACSGRRYGALLVAAELVFAMQLVDAGRFRPLPRRYGHLLLLAVAFVEFGLGVVLVSAAKSPFAQVPREAVAFIEEQGLPERVFNPYHWGGYLDFAWHRRRKVFIDGRINLFSDNGVLEDARTIENAAPGALELLDAYEIATVLAERGSPLDRLLSHEGAWRHVFLERLATVYVRR